MLPRACVCGVSKGGPLRHFRRNDLSGASNSTYTSNTKYSMGSVMRSYGGAIIQYTCTTMLSQQNTTSLLRFCITTPTQSPSCSPLPSSACSLPPHSSHYILACMRRESMIFVSYKNLGKLGFKLATYEILVSEPG